MLELRPICENCAKPLPPESIEAMICTFECTFCRDCVNTVIGNVCPNCGGGFCDRPVRPVQNWNGDNHLAANPATTVRRHRPVEPGKHALLVARVGSLPPERR